MEAKICDNPDNYIQVWVISPYFYECSVMLSKSVWEAKWFFSRGTVISRVVSVQPLSHVYNPRDCSMPGVPALPHLLEFAQPHVHWVGDAIQTSCPLLSPSPHFCLSQYQGLFQWVSSLHQVAKVLELHFGIRHLIFLSPTPLTPVAVPNN